MEDVTMSDAKPLSATQVALAAMDDLYKASDAILHMGLSPEDLTGSEQYLDAVALAGMIIGDPSTASKKYKDVMDDDDLKELRDCGVGVTDEELNSSVLDMLKMRLLEVEGVVTLVGLKRGL